MENEVVDLKANSLPQKTNVNRELILQITGVLANHLVLYYKASAFHWNVEGPSFVSLHKLFQDIYEDLQSNIDKLGEHIRKIRGYPPSHLMDLLSYATIATSKKTPDSLAMVKELESDMIALHDCLMMAFKCAESCNNQALMNYLADRMDSTQMWAWQMRAFAKNH